MLRIVAVLALVACGSAPPPKINTPQDYQNVVAELVAQVIDAFKSDGVNCDMLSHDLESVKASAKFKTAHDWGTSHPDGPKLAHQKIDEKKADFESSARAAMRQCGGDLQEVMGELLK